MADSAGVSDNVMHNYIAGRARLRRLRNIRIGLTLLLVLTILGFMGLIYSRAKAQYTKEQFEKPMAKEAKRLEPVLKNAARNTIENLQPIYLAEAKKSLKQVAPRLRKVAAKEMNEVGESLSSDVKAQLRECLRKVYNAQMEVLREHFPNWSDNERKELFRKRLEKGLQEDTDGILVDFEKMYVREIHDVQATVQKFRPNRFERFNQEELGRYFVHLWLMMLDQHLVERKGDKSHG